MEIYHIKDIFKVYVAQCGIECVGRCLSYFAVDFGILVFAADGEVVDGYVVAVAGDGAW